MTSIHDQLRAAAKHGNDRQIKALLDHTECKATSQDANGYTALMWAAGRGHLACVELLIPVSHLVAQDTLGMTALMWAAKFGQLSCTKLLMSVSEAMLTNHDGKTASELATSTGHHHIAQLIDTHALAQIEALSLHDSISLGITRKTHPFRV